MLPTVKRAVLLLGLAALTGPAALSQPAPANAARPLTLSVGPRDGVWKRVFNPLLYEADTRWPAAAGIYEPLIVYNRATASYMPWLGTHYDWSENNKRLKFTLRPGVTWSDGVAFSARDVVFTFELLRTFPALDRLKMWDFLSDVTAVGGTTVDFVFKRPYTPGLISIGQLPIVPEHKWKAVANPATFDDASPVGTGPFTEVLRFEPTFYELGRNPHYWQPGKPLVSSLRVSMYHSNQEIVRALEKDELDWASLFIPNIEKTYVAEDPARHSYWYPDFGTTTLLYLNTQKKPFDDKNVRKAVSMAIDRPRIMTEAISGYAPPADATGLAESGRGRVATSRRRTGSSTPRGSRAAPTVSAPCPVAAGCATTSTPWPDGATRRRRPRSSSSRSPTWASPRSRRRSPTRPGATGCRRAASTWGSGARREGPRPTSSIAPRWTPPWCDRSARRRRRTSSASRAPRRARSCGSSRPLPTRASSSA